MFVSILFPNVFITEYLRTAQFPIVALYIFATTKKFRASVRAKWNYI